MTNTHDIKPGSELAGATAGLRNGMAVTDEPGNDVRVYRARKSWLVIAIVLGFLFVGGGAILLLLSGLSRITRYAPVLVAIGTGWILTFAWALLRDVPRITLSRDGLVSDGYLRRRTWAWDEIGPFSMSCSGNRMFVCTQHRKQKSSPGSLQAAPTSPPIRIDVSLLFALNDRAAVQRLVDDLNAWWDRFGDGISG